MHLPVFLISNHETASAQWGRCVRNGPRRRDGGVFRDRTRENLALLSTSSRLRPLTSKRRASKPKALYKKRFGVFAGDAAPLSDIRARQTEAVDCQPQAAKRICGFAASRFGLSGLIRIWAMLVKETKRKLIRPRQAKCKGSLQEPPLM